MIAYKLKLKYLESEKNVYFTSKPCFGTDGALVVAVLALQCDLVS